MTKTKMIHGIMSVKPMTKIAIIDVIAIIAISISHSTHPRIGRV